MYISFTCGNCLDSKLVSTSNFKIGSLVNDIDQWVHGSLPNWTLTHPFKYLIPTEIKADLPKNIVTQKNNNLVNIQLGPFIYHSTQIFLLIYSRFINLFTLKLSTPKHKY